MRLLLLIMCMSQDCSGALFTEQDPLIIMTSNEKECHETGKDKAAAFSYWMHYQFVYVCVPTSYNDNLNPVG